MADAQAQCQCGVVVAVFDHIDCLPRNTDDLGKLGLRNTASFACLFEFFVYHSHLLTVLKRIFQKEQRFSEDAVANVMPDEVFCLLVSEMGGGGVFRSAVIKANSCRTASKAKLPVGDPSVEMLCCLCRFFIADGADQIVNAGGKKDHSADRSEGESEGEDPSDRTSAHNEKEGEDGKTDVDDALFSVLFG